MGADRPAQFTGTALRRAEDLPLVRGEGHYLDDITPEATLHLALVRSPLAHARVLSVDTAEAREAPGTVIVLTGEDVTELVAPPRPSEDRRIPHRLGLVRDVVRAVGDPVAAVVAESKALARDAADLVFVDYEPLPVVADMDTALDGPPLYPEYGDNIAFERSGGDPADLDGLEGAAIVVEGTVDHPRVAPTPLETRGCIAAWDGGKLTLHLGTQAPTLMAEELAWVFDISLEAIRIIVPDMGGAFGSKFDLAEEEIVVIESARRTGRPVKWVEGRRESLLVVGHGRAQRHHYKAVADADGKVLALWVDSLVDVGARKRYFSGAPYTPRMGTGNYDIGTYAWRQRGVFTNRAPQGIYRGAGRPEATLTMERVMDHIALSAGIDPVEVRRRNFITEFPYESPGGVTYDSGDYHAALDRLLEIVDYEGLRRRQHELREAGRYLGVGLAAYVEATGFERSERARMRVEADGKVRVFVGTLDHGQGHRTTFAQLVADELGISPDRVSIVQGDTEAIPFGGGTSGSRSAGHGGSSVVDASRRVAARAARIAAHLFEADPEDIVFADGVIGVVGSPGATVTWEQVVEAANDRAGLDPGESPGLEAEVEWNSGGLTFPFGMDLVVVEVDPETGEVGLTDVVAVDDCGVVLNPMIAYGQRHGGMVQGIGQALFEEVVYDADGNLLTGSLLDYLVPAATQVPELRLGETVTPSTTNLLGAKGIGEAGAVGIPAAIVNAVVDALRPFGVEHLDLPLRPEKVWRAIHD